jgi:flagellar biosynthesis/type III secretory pathway protein FliH
MSGAFSSLRGRGGLLFDEDFDAPPPDPDDPEIIEPMYSAAELLAAREEAARESRAAVLAEIDTSTRTALGLALAQISGQLAAARAEAAAIAEQNSEAVASLLLNCFATAFPVLAARHGSAETAAVLRALLPALHHEPKITVRVNPHLIAALTEEFLSSDSDLAARVRLIPTDAVALGDVRVAWDHGSAARDTMSLWNQIETILAPAGLLNAATPPTIKENDLGQ